MVLRSVCMFSAVALSSSADTSCTEEEVSLMQGQAHQLKVGRSGTSRLDVRTDNVPASTLLESVKQMAGSVNSMERIEPEAVTSFQAAIDESTTVLGASKTLINTEHGNAQEAINVAGVALHDCTHSDMSGEQTWNYFEDLVQSTQQTHQTCRNVEHALTETMNSECNAMDDWITSFEHTADHALSLSHENADALGPELTRVNNFAQDGFDQWQTKHTACRTAERNLADHPQREPPAEGGGGCNIEQATFEGSYCSRWTTCLTFNDCWQREERELDAIVELEETNRGLRQNEWLALNHAECLLGLIRAAITADPPEQVDSDAMQSCEQTHGSESALPEVLRSFDLPDTTFPTYCDDTHESPDPCSPEFLDAEYASFGQRDTMPPCAPCQRPPLSGEASGPWTLILQTGDEPYAVTPEAVGVPNEDVIQFAKLSDAAINALPDMGADCSPESTGDDCRGHIYKFTSASLRDGFERDEMVIYVHWTIHWDDTSPGMFDSENHRFQPCNSPGTHHLLDPEVLEPDGGLPDFTQCQFGQTMNEDWFDTRHSITTHQFGCTTWSTGGPPGDRDQAHQNTRETRIRNLCSVTGHISTTHRCFRPVGYCGDPTPMRQDVKIYKLTGAIDDDSWRAQPR